MRVLVCTALSLMLIANTAYAACGWVKWRVAYVPASGKEPLIELLEAFSDYEACKKSAQATIAKDLEFYKKSFEGYSIDNGYKFQMGGYGHTVEIKCLPSDIDPREPKSK